MPLILAIILILSFAQSGFAQVSKDEYFARSTLNENELEFYDSCYNGALQIHNNIDVSGYGIDLDQASQVLSALFIDSPELYFINFQKELQSINNLVTSVSYSYDYPYNEVFNLNLQLRKESSNILSLLTNDMTEYEKVKTIYTNLGETIEYDTDSADNKTGGISSKPARESQTIIGGLINKKAVCGGIARSLQYMLYQIDIPCYCVIGQTDGENHVWNILQIDGQWYYADLTRDLDYIKHNMLLQFLYDDSFLEDHQIIQSQNPPLPACTSDKYMIQTQIIPEIKEIPLTGPALKESLVTSANQFYAVYSSITWICFAWAAIIAAAVVVLIVLIKKRVR